MPPKPPTMPKPTQPLVRNRQKSATKPAKRWRRHMLVTHALAHPEHHEIPPFWKGSAKLLFGKKMNVLLCAFPVGIYWGVMHPEDKAMTFALCCTAILPLAAVLGEATEQVAAHTNETLGGLLNATFGNATELLIAIFMLMDGKLEVVKVSLLGSILSNILLVLGFACFAGGMTKTIQTFNSTVASANTTLLLMAVLGMSVPTCMNSIGELDASVDLHLSRAISILLLILYVLYVYFQLVTARKYFEDHAPQNDTDEHDEEETEEIFFTMGGALTWLLLATVGIAYLSEFLTDAIEGACEDLGLSTTFAGFVIVPIVGNAAEHATAVTMAYKSKMDLAFGVALGSSTQIALFVVPVMVLIGWIIGQPLDLFFGMFETMITFLATIVVSFVVGDGETNWLEGASLLFGYMIIGLAFFFYNPEADQTLQAMSAALGTQE